MKWFKKLLDRGRHEYSGPDFRVRIEPVFREAVSVVYSHSGRTVRLGGEYIGSKWSGIQVVIPQEITTAEACRIAGDLAVAFESMEYGYVVLHALEIETVSESERNAAFAELREMGYDVEVQSDGKVRQTKRPEAPKRDFKTLKQQAPRMMALVQAVHGSRPSFATLAKSKEFE